MRSTFESPWSRNTGPSRRMVLFVLEALMAAVATLFGILLMINGLGMPLDTLDRSPFTSFMVPGLILSTLVGGSLAIAALLAWYRHHAAGPAGLIAGGVLLGWIVIEALMVHEGRIQQGIVLTWAIAIILLAWPHERHTEPPGNRRSAYAA